MMVAAPQQSSPIFLLKERLYVGIDIGKENHVAAFLSDSLLRKRKHYTASPTIPVANSRLDFERLVTRMQHYAPLEQCMVLLECTGHYHLSLLQYLQERGITVYTVHVQKRPRKQKNDKRDAQGLANTLYRQVELGAQPDDTEQEVHKAAPTPETAQALHSLTQYYGDLNKQTVRTKNQLTAISDQLFPEFSLIFKDVNGPTARIFREKYPTPTDVANASLEDLKACQIWTRPGKKACQRLQELAQQSIGIKEPGKIRALMLQQSLLIKQLRVLEENEEAVKQEIAAIVETSREGQIIMSIGDFVGSLAAGEIIAAIGSIENFESASKFKGYTGWMPVEDQSGKSRNGVMLSKGGNRMLRDAMYLIGMRAVNGKYDTEWARIYQRLVARQCPLDESVGKRRGKMRPLSRIIGQISSMIYKFLREDADLIASTPPGTDTRPPTLYNKEIHRAHINRRR